jgi:hypothetical protein
VNIKGFTFHGCVQGFHASKVLRGRGSCHAFRCIANIKDECAHDYAGCWRDDFTVNGQKKTFHACKDNIALYKVGATEEVLGFGVIWLGLEATSAFANGQKKTFHACKDDVAPLQGARNVSASGKRIWGVRVCRD